MRTKKRVRAPLLHPKGGALATLADDALRLTPAGAPERPERLLALAQRIDQTGDSRRMVALLEPELNGLPPAWRARAHLLLADGSGISHADQHFAHLDAAVRTIGDVAALLIRHERIGGLGG